MLSSSPGDHREQKEHTLDSMFEKVKEMMDEISIEDRKKIRDNVNEFFPEHGPFWMINKFGYTKELILYYAKYDKLKHKGRTYHY